MAIVMMSEEEYRQLKAQYWTVEKAEEFSQMKLRVVGLEKELGEARELLGDVLAVLEGYERQFPQTINTLEEFLNV